MSEQFNETMKFNPLKEDKKKIQDILSEVYKALKEKGYDPENQLIGYIFIRRSDLYYKLSQCTYINSSSGSG